MRHPSQVFLELFPASVKPSDGSGPVTPARVYVKGGVARVFRSNGVGGVELALEGAVASVEQSRNPRRSPHVVRLEDGTEWSVRKTSGCGCGHPLKKFDPGSWRP